MFSLICEILTQLSILLGLLGVTRSEEPELLGRASTFHSDVARLKHIYAKFKIYLLQLQENIGEKYQNFEIPGHL